MAFGRHDVYDVIFNKKKKYLFGRSSKFEVRSSNLDFPKNKNYLPFSLPIESSVVIVVVVVVVVVVNDDDESSSAVLMALT